jgi:hypothetical protein
MIDKRRKRCAKFNYFAQCWKELFVYHNWIVSRLSAFTESYKLQVIDSGELDSKGCRSIRNFTS